MLLETHFYVLAWGIESPIYLWFNLAQSSFTLELAGINFNCLTKRISRIPGG